MGKTILLPLPDVRHRLREKRSDVAPRSAFIKINRTDLGRPCTARVIHVDEILVLLTAAVTSALIKHYTVSEVTGDTSMCIGHGCLPSGPLWVAKLDLPQKDVA